MYKQLSDAYLSSAQAYAKLAEVEQIAIKNKEIAEESQAAVIELNAELRKVQSKASEFEIIKNVFMNASMNDFRAMLQDIRNVNISNSNYDSEDEYIEAIEYQERLANIMASLLNTRHAIAIEAED